MTEVISHNVLSINVNFELTKLVEGSDLPRFLTKPDTISEWMWQIYFKYMAFPYIGSAFITTSVVLYSWLMQEYDGVEESFHTAKIM